MAKNKWLPKLTRRWHRYNLKKNSEIAPMKRFILTLGGLLAFCLFTPDYLTSRADAQNSASENKPNVIVIYTDDQGYGDVSALNPNAKFQTPNLDRLAKEGIAFTHGHSPDSVCTPSRYGLLTGRYCWRTKRKRCLLYTSPSPRD